MITEHMLKTWAFELGFTEAALCSLEGFDRIRQAVEQQKPLRERKHLRFYPEVDFPQAKCLAVLLWPYAPAVKAEGETLFVDNYYFASNAAYHAAQTLEARILSEGGFAKANVSYPAKEAALRAGLGWIGKSSLLITPQHGTRVVIILMATDIEHDAQKSNLHPCLPSSCVNCGRCAAACPSGAIDIQGMSHPEKCLRNFMMEGVTVPKQFRRRVGMRMIGCDICQRVCPMQPHKEPVRSPVFALDQFATTDQKAFSDAVARLAEEIGRNTARPQRVRAQTALLAGNSGNPAYLPVLREWASSSFDAVREHALWAIEQLESSMAGT